MYISPPVYMYMHVYQSTSIHVPPPYSNKWLLPHVRVMKCSKCRCTCTCMSIIRVGWRGTVNTCQGLLGWLGNCIIIWGNNLTSHRFPPLVSYFQSKQREVSIHVGLILCTHTSQTPRWLHRSQPERQYSGGVAGTCVCYIHVPPDGVSQKGNRYSHLNKPVYRPLVP